MKSLVLASYAQSGVGAERKARTPALTLVGRSPMAWGVRPCRRGDLNLCADVLPLVVFPIRVRLRLEPAMRCYPASGRERCVQSSLPCVGRRGLGRRGAQVPGQGRRVQSPETLPAKEDRNR